MVAVDHLDVFELVGCVVDLGIGLRVDVGHVAPVVRVRWPLARVEDKAIDTCAVDGCLQVVDAAIGRSMPTEIY